MNYVTYYSALFSFCSTFRILCNYNLFGCKDTTMSLFVQYLKIVFFTDT